jgi:hypothetical protein
VEELEKILTELLWLFEVPPRLFHRVLKCEVKTAFLGAEIRFLDIRLLKTSSRCVGKTRKS